MSNQVKLSENQESKRFQTFEKCEKNVTEFSELSENTTDLTHLMNHEYDLNDEIKDFSSMIHQNAG